MANQTARCACCGAANSQLVKDTAGNFVCRHRRACEARQMLQRGESPVQAAGHAQKHNYAAR
jgi:hypothetical protein